MLSVYLDYFASNGQSVLSYISDSDTQDAMECRCCLTNGNVMLSTTDRYVFIVIKLLPTTGLLAAERQGQR